MATSRAVDSTSINVTPKRGESPSRCNLTLEGPGGPPENHETCPVERVRSLGGPGGLSHPEGPGEGAAGPQATVDPAHELRRRLVGDVPLRGQDRAGAGDQERPRQTEPFLAGTHQGARGLTGRERDPAGLQRELGELARQQPAVGELEPRL